MNDTKNNYQHPEFLVDTEWLENNLHSEYLRIIDCTVNVEPNPDLQSVSKYPFVFHSGLENFEKAHIPHAGYIDIANELSDATSAIPLMNPSDDQFIEIMSNFGVTTDTQVILYSATEKNWATRLWWMLRSNGFTNAAILNGGWQKWQAEGRPTSNRACAYPAGEFITKKTTELFVDKDSVLSAIGNDNIRIINSLPKPIFSGTSDVTFGRKGRIASSVNVPFMSLQDSDTGQYLAADKLQALFDTVNVDSAEQLITYCGGGIAATNNAFVLTLLGYENVSVYDGSMLEWGNDKSLPMEIDL